MVCKKSCSVCGWNHGKIGHLAECPAECNACGYRHGSHPSKKIPADCQQKVDHPDAQKGAKYYQEIPTAKRVVPGGAKDGWATADNNNCLIHTLYQIAYNVQSNRDSQCLASEQRYCREVRNQLVAKFGAPSRGFLDLSDHWESILAEMGVEPGRYAISCHARDGHAEVHGCGGRAMWPRNAAYNHFAPIWPLSAGEAFAAQPSSPRPAPWAGTCDTSAQPGSDEAADGVTSGSECSEDAASKGSGEVDAKAKRRAGTSPAMRLPPTLA